MRLLKTNLVLENTGITRKSATTSLPSLLCAISPARTSVGAFVSRGDIDILSGPLDRCWLTDLSKEEEYCVLREWLVFSLYKVVSQVPAVAVFHDKVTTVGELFGFVKLYEILALLGD